MGRTPGGGSPGPVSSVPRLCLVDTWVKAEPFPAPQLGASPVGWSRCHHLAVGCIVVASPHLLKLASI